MSCYNSLPRNRIHKKEETITLNLPSHFMESFYKEFLDGIDLPQDNVFNRSLLSKDVKNFLLATSNFAEEIQGELDLCVS